MKINLKSSFLKSLSVLTGGSLFANIILALTQIALARIFSPSDLGIFSYLMSVPMGFVGVICGRYDLTIVYEKDEQKVFSLLKLNLLINIVLSTTITVIYSLFLLIFKPEYAQYIYLMPAIFIYLVAFGLGNTLNSYNNRYRDYLLITKMYVYRTIAQSLGTVILGFIFVYMMKKTELSVAILLVPYCIGLFMGVYQQGKEVWKKRDKILHIPMKNIYAVAAEHKKQPILSAPAIFANGFSYSLITMYTEQLYGSAVNGYYSISTRLLGMPISLISGNLSKIYMERASKEFNETGEFKHSLIQTFKFLAILSVPMFLAMFYLAPPVCAFIFGGDWVIAGDFIRILAIMFTFRFITTALSPGLYICGKQQVELIIQIALLVVTAICGAISYVLNFPVEGYLWMISISRSGVLIINTLLVFKYSGFFSKRRGKQNEENS